MEAVPLPFLTSFLPLRLCCFITTLTSSRIVPHWSSVSSRPSLCLSNSYIRNLGIWLFQAHFIEPWTRPPHLHLHLHRSNFLRSSSFPPSHHTYDEINTSFSSLVGAFDLRSSTDSHHSGFDIYSL
jgi:hypothetical protein